MRWARAVLAAAMPATLVPAVALAPIVGAQGLPQTPADPGAHEVWVGNPAREAEGTESLGAEVMEISGGGVVAAGCQARVTIKVSAPQARRVTLLPRVGAKAADLGAARVALAESLGSYPVTGEPVIVDAAEAEQTSRAAGDAGAFSAREVVVELPELAPGLYPVAIEVRTDAEVTSQRFLLSVTADSSSGAGTGETAKDDAGKSNRDAGAAPGRGDAASTIGAGPAVSTIVPIAEPVKVVPGETGGAPTPGLVLEDDSLAESMRPGGRLDRLLDVLEKQGPRSGTCLAIDPNLVATAHRMTSGYTVAGRRVSQAQRQQRLRDSWTSTKDPSGEPGGGADDAAKWLDRLRALAQGCTVAMPWANTDLEAVARTGDEWLMREAVHRGPATLEDVLDAQPIRDVVLPGSGYLTAVTAHSLRLIGPTPTEAGEIEKAWEAEHAHGGTAEAQGAGSAGQVSDAASSQDGSEQAEPGGAPVRVLVAENTIWGEGEIGRFAQLEPGVRAVTMQGSLAATLDLLGEDPVTPAYSNPDSRFDFRIDSAAARKATARAAVGHELEERAREAAAAGTASGPGATADSAWAVEHGAGLPSDTGPGPGAGGDPLLITFPSTVSPEGLAAVLDETAAAPQAPLSAYLEADERTEQELAVAGRPEFGLPFVVDPGGHADTEVQRATQEALYTDELTRIMENQDSIVLTRYGFSSPLLREVLGALTVTGRRSIATFDQAVSETSRRLDGGREMLQSLRSSVELVPPGNVYTRSSESSPLLIVARNGLPLPAKARLNYATTTQAALNVPAQLSIPAQGSITVEMTADVPESKRQTELSLWLSTVDGAQISDPVAITVQTRSTLVKVVLTAVGLVGAVAIFAAFQAAKRRRFGFR